MYLLENIGTQLSNKSHKTKSYLIHLFQESTKVPIPQVKLELVVEYALEARQKRAG